MFIGIWLYGITVGDKVLMRVCLNVIPEMVISVCLLASGYTHTHHFRGSDNSVLMRMWLHRSSDTVTKMSLVTRMTVDVASTVWIGIGIWLHMVCQ